ncbi:MAG: hypothetical protein CMH52_10810 [Myxococcales bacterium]|nr:hypothetical protein [Myxococcales bacterium]
MFLLSRASLVFCLLFMVGCVADETAESDRQFNDGPSAAMDSDLVAFDGGVSPDLATSQSDRDDLNPADAASPPVDMAPGDDAVGSSDRPRPPVRLGRDRPAAYYLPIDYDPSEPMPLLVALHGYTENAAVLDAYMGLSEMASALGVLLIMPNGRVNDYGQRYWDASTQGVLGQVDARYIRGLIEEAERYFSIDRSRVGVLGLSNGGSMAYRLACEASDLVSSIIVLSGFTWSNPNRCGQPEPVSVLAVHGTWDTLVRYDGRDAVLDIPTEPVDYDMCRVQACAETATACDENPDCLALAQCAHACGWEWEPDPIECRQICWLQAPRDVRGMWYDDFVCTVNAGCFDSPTDLYEGYPSVDEAVRRWVLLNGCQPEGEPGIPKDLVRGRAGVDTEVTIWPSCDRDTRVELWSMQQVVHRPLLRTEFTSDALYFFLNTPRRRTD